MLRFGCDSSMKWWNWTPRRKNGCGGCLKRPSKSSRHMLVITLIWPSSSHQRNWCKQLVQTCCCTNHLSYMENNLWSSIASNPSLIVFPICMQTGTKSSISWSSWGKHLVSNMHLCSKNWITPKYFEIVRKHENWIHASEQCNRYVTWDSTTNAT